MRARLAAALTAAALLGALAVTQPASAAGYLVGPDISSYQHPNGAAVNWDTVYASQSFAIVKATEDADYTSPTFRGDWTKLQAKGGIRGTYHYARPSGAANDALNEARYYISVTGTLRERNQLPPILDLEETGGLGQAALRTWIQTWLTEVQRLTGRKPMIYVSPGFWDANVNSTAFGSYPLQVAHYTTAAAPRLPVGWSKWTMWQYTDNATVAGIPAATDHNRFNGDLAALRALANGAGGGDLVGVWDPSGHSFHLLAANAAGNSRWAFQYGAVGDLPVTGDWDGNGKDSVGVFRPGTDSGTFHLSNDLTSGTSDYAFASGLPTDLPLAGDWNGDGKDSVGIYRPSDGTFHLRDALSEGSSTYAFSFGPDNTNLIPLAGDWNGDGKDSIGYYDPATSRFTLTNTLGGGDTDYTYVYGRAGDQPFVGDWDGNRTDTPAVFRPATTQFLLANAQGGGDADITFTGFTADQVPLHGAWG
ncbi:GH25 family lysozyme [Actinoplanes oblitus]|uniref:GH25 family lysozyme n=1 Tax=Actinoplanes oblitus TaxID=3040509 RepID=A0ABY8W5A6_9ACTN|nr:GH25 family lysozyme [Actinoplanes oblitus]WIM92995.1 GH25 family lysozyme [Actinoplanes oblitus]